MPLQSIPGFVGPSYELPDFFADGQKTVNFFPELTEVGTSRQKAWLYGIPGAVVFGSPSAIPVRGFYASTLEALYVVEGTVVWMKASVDAAWTQIGTLRTSVGYVDIRDNGLQVCFVDGPYGYIYKPADGTFVQITSTGWLGSYSVEFCDGFFVFVKPASQIFYISALYDGTTEDPLMFASAESSPDNLVRTLNADGNLWMMGTKTFEVYYNSGGSFPFVRQPGIRKEIGVSAARSIQILDSAPVWLGGGENGQGVVWKASGSTPQRISTAAVERDISRFDQSTAKSWIHQRNGHSFYGLTFDNADTTWVYDSVTGAWCERKSFVPATGEFTAYRFNFFARIWGRLLAASELSGDVYEITDSAIDDAGVVIPGIRRSPHLLSTSGKFSYSEVMLDTNAGHTRLQNYALQAMLRYSDTGGRTWSTERWRSLGAIGEISRRARWFNLGEAKDRVFEVKVENATGIILSDLLYDGSASYDK